MSIHVCIPEPWHYRNWEPVLRHLPEAVLQVEGWSWRPPEHARAAMLQTAAWLQSLGAGPLQIGPPDLEPHVEATLSIAPRRVGRQGRQVRMLYAVTHKAYTYSEHNRDYDLVLVSSEFGRRRLEKVGVRAAVVGYPKLDACFNGERDRAAARRELDLAPESTVVLYAPTFHAGCTVEHHAAALSALPEEWTLLVQLHPISYLTEAQRFAGLPAGTRLVRPERSGIDALLAADVILTDTSGVFFEACALDRPVLTLEAPGGVEGAAGDPEVDHRDAGLPVAPGAEIAPVVETALGADDRGARRAEVRDLLFHHPGEGGRRAAAALREMEKEAQDHRLRDLDLIYNRMRVLERCVLAEMKKAASDEAASQNQGVAPTT